GDGRKGNDTFANACQRNRPIFGASDAGDATAIPLARGIVNPVEERGIDRLLDTGQDLGGGRNEKRPDGPRQREIEHRVPEDRRPRTKSVLEARLAGPLQRLMPKDLLTQVGLKERDEQSAVILVEPGGGHEALSPELLLMPVDRGIREEIVG